MSSYQRYLPIIEDGKPNNILGMIDMSANVAYEGNETQQAITTPGGVLNVSLQKIVPQPSTLRQQNPWYMAAKFSHADVYNKAYMGFPFVPIDDVMPGSQWSSASGKANVFTSQDGLLLYALSNEEGFAVGMPASTPVNTVLPVISGTATAGQLQTSTQGTWNLATSFAYQWQRDIASVWTDQVGATALTYTPGVAGTYRIRVSGINIRGTTFAYSANRVIA